MNTGLILTMIIFICVLIGLIPENMMDGWIGILIGFTAAVIGWWVMVSDFGRAK